MCRTPNRAIHHLREEYDDSENDDQYYSSGEEIDHFVLDCVKEENRSNEQVPNEVFVKLLLNCNKKEIAMNFKIDTGAQVNCIPYKYYKEHLSDSVKLSKKNLAKPSSYDGNQLRVKGKCIITCYWKTTKQKLEFYIVDTPSKPVLGLSTCQSLNLIKLMMTIDAEENGLTKESVLKKYPELFDGDTIGCFEGEIQIKLNPGVKPSINPPRRVPIALQHKIKEELTKMEKMRVIKKVTEPTEWVS